MQLKKKGYGSKRMRQHIRNLDYQQITITDELFGSYAKKVYEKIIPHQWDILNDRIEDSEPSYCIHNFRVAAGERCGERLGVVFLDTDLYKWLESVAFCIAGGHGKEYEEIADKVISLIGRAQEKDGYLNTYYTVNAPHKKWTNLVEGHELYTSGHMIEAAVAYYEATGKKDFLNIAQKNADLICKVFGNTTGKKNGYPGHQEIELALIKLYRVTGKKQYLDTANYFIGERGSEPNYLIEEMRKRGGCEFFPELKNYDLPYSQAHMRPIHQKTAEGHAVRAMYMCAAMADLAEELNDEEMLAACKEIWSNVVNARMYITGGIGTSGFRERFTTDYDLPNNTNYAETCASIGLMMFGQRMTSVTGEAGYYDAVELALYNTVLAGINIAGDRYFYVNPLEVVPEFCTQHTYMDHVKPVRQKWFSVACCPPNVARTLASLGQYIYAQDDENLYIHQFISSNAKAKIGNSEVTIEQNSQLLQTGKTNLHIMCTEPVKVKIRIPGYATDYQVQHQGETVKVPLKKGYLTLELTSGEHDIALDFGIKPRWVGANDRVRADVGKAALMKGPVVYCLEEADNGKFLSNIYIQQNVAITEAEPIEQLVGEVPSLTYSGVRIHNKKTESGALYAGIEYEKAPVRLKAIPYCMWNNRGIGEMLVWNKVLI